MQFFRFGLVGTCAALLHVVIFLHAIDTARFTAVGANTLAFGVTFVFAYLGHRFWTFKPSHSDRQLKGATLFKFLTVALTGYCINTLISWLVVDRGDFAPLWAVLLMATFTPITVFCLAKYWAFAAQPVRDLAERSKLP